MSKADILQELPRLQPEERHEIMERICELEERDVLGGPGSAVDEKALLDREMEEFQRNPDSGASWEEVEARLRGSSQR